MPRYRGCHLGEMWDARVLRWIGAPRHSSGYSYDVLECSRKGASINIMATKTMPNTNDFQPSQVRISKITPEIDCGATPVKRVISDRVVISAEIVAASPLIVGGVIRYRADGKRYWEQAPLTPDSTNRDLYTGEFVVNALGRWRYAIEAWVDRAATWQNELRRRLEGGQTDLE